MITASLFENLATNTAVWYVAAIVVPLIIATVCCGIMRLVNKRA